jgi:C-terminal processing protease CtpA/Prc
MKIKRIAFGILMFFLLACNFVAQMVFPPTATPSPTASQTASATPSPTTTPVPLVPAFIPPECSTVPLATLSPEQVTLATPVFPTKEISQEEQLHILDRLTSIVEDVYVYPDYNGRNWNEIQARYRSKIEAGLDTMSFYNEMDAMIEELGDEHSFFLSPQEVDEAEAELRGDLEFVGVGIYGRTDLERQRLIVISTFPGSPAEYGGIQHHDSILLVNGHPIGEKGAELLSGPQCSAVVLTVQSPGEEPRDVMLVQYVIEGGIPIDARLVPTSDGSKIGYIFIPSFFDETLPGQIANALNEFGPLDGLLLDVRQAGTICRPHIAADPGNRSQ